MAPIAMRSVVPMMVPIAISTNGCVILAPMAIAIGDHRIHHNGTNGSTKRCYSFYNHHFLQFLKRQWCQGRQWNQCRFICDNGDSGIVVAICAIVTPVAIG
ncbi:hypothetical protein ACHWQZ_G004958 [Mnemiopsis leidyi]